MFYMFYIQAVFNKGQDSGEVVNLWQSGTDRMSDLVLNTNVGVPGRIIVRTDPENISVTCKYVRHV